MFADFELLKHERFTGLNFIKLFFLSLILLYAVLTVNEKVNFKIILYYILVFY